MLEVKNLSKIYQNRKKQVTAIKKLDFTMEKGDHLAVIGSNGSGKTTLFKIMTQLSHPTTGKILVDNEEISHRHKSKFGLMLGKSMIYHRLTVRQNLEYYSMLYGVKNARKKIEKMTKDLGIFDKIDDFVEHLSEGTKSKVAYARATLHNPEYLILDEPTDGVDPISTDILHWHIKNYPSVIFSSHSLYEVADIANKVLILNQGELVFFGTMDEICKDKKTDDITDKLKSMYNQCTTI